MRITILLGVAAMSIGLVAAKPITDKDPVKGIEFFDGTWEEAVALSEKEGKPIFLDAYASWCGPCKMIAPILDEISVELKDKVLVTKVNLDDNQDLALKYSIRSIPSILLFEDGNLLDIKVGLSSKSDLLGWIESKSSK